MNKKRKGPQWHPTDQWARTHCTILVGQWTTGGEDGKCATERPVGRPRGTRTLGRAAAVTAVGDRGGSRRDRRGADLPPTTPPPALTIPNSPSTRPRRLVNAATVAVRTTAAAADIASVPGTGPEGHRSPRRRSRQRRCHTMPPTALAPGGKGGGQRGRLRESRPRGKRGGESAAAAARIMPRRGSHRPSSQRQRQRPVATEAAST